MKTAEEILRGHYESHGIDTMDFSQIILPAMEEYAAQFKAPSIEETDKEFSETSKKFIDQAPFKKFSLMQEEPRSIASDRTEPAPSKKYKKSESIEMPELDEIIGRRYSKDK